MDKIEKKLLDRLREHLASLEIDPNNIKNVTIQRKGQDAFLIIDSTMPPQTLYETTSIEDRTTGAYLSVTDMVSGFFGLPQEEFTKKRKNQGRVGTNQGEVGTVLSIPIAKIEKTQPWIESATELYNQVKMQILNYYPEYSDSTDHTDLDFLEALTNELFFRTLLDENVFAGTITQEDFIDGPVFSCRVHEAVLERTFPSYTLQEPEIQAGVHYSRGISTTHTPPSDRSK